MDLLDASDTFERICRLNEQNPQLVAASLEHYLATTSRNLPAAVFKTLAPAREYRAFLDALGFDDRQIVYWHYPTSLQNASKKGDSGANPDGTHMDERYWTGGLRIGRLLQRHTLMTRDLWGRLAILVSMDSLTPTSRPDRNHRAFGFRFGMFAAAVWLAVCARVEIAGSGLVSPDS